MMKMGLQADSISVLAAVFQGCLALAAILAVSHQNALATWLLIPLVSILAYVGPRSGFLDFLRLNQAESKLHYQIAHHFIAMQRVKLRLATTREEVLVLINQTCRELGVRCYRLRVKPDDTGKGGTEFFHQNDDALISRREGATPAPGMTDAEEVYDFCEMPGLRGEAFWIFDAHLAGDDVDLEYRVLMNGFMKEALDQCIRLGEGAETLELPRVVRLPYHRTGAHHLRKRSNKGAR